jgi:multidrug resistance efflux pump
MKKGVLFKALRVAAVLVTAAAIAILLVRFSPKAERQIPVETGRLVEVLAVKARTIHMTVEAYGTVNPREILKLVAEVPGQIVGIHPAFKEGGFVTTGKALIKIDPRTYQLEVERQRVQVSQVGAELRRVEQEVQNLAASIKIAKSDVALAQKEVNRLKALSVKNVIAQTTLDQAEQRYLSSLERLQNLENQLALTGPTKEQLEAQRQMAMVMLKQAQLDLEKSSIGANFDAWVLEKNVEEGQHVVSGQLLGSIYRDGALDIEVRIPTKELKWLPSGISKSNSPEVDVIFSSDNTSFTWQGRVARIKAEMDETTRTLPMVIEVNASALSSDAEDRPLLRPGMFVTAKIKGREFKQAFVLPRWLVHSGDVVYTVRDNQLRIKTVNIVRSFKDKVFIDRGLKDGDLVVTTPLSTAAEGMKVRLKN